MKNSFNSAPLFIASLAFILLISPFDIYSQDKSHSDDLIPISFDSHGSTLRGYFSPAKGEGPHPTIIFLHGSPGGKEDVLGLAQAAPQADWNAMVFTFRGFWDSEGIYTLQNTQEDVFSALEFIKSPDIVKKWNVDIDQIAIAGYSFGGAIAVAAAANNPSINQIITIAAADMGWIAQQIEKSEEFKSMVIAALDKRAEGPVRGLGGKQSVDDLLAKADKYDLVINAKALATRSLLIIGGWKDQESTLENHVLPFIRALQSHGAENLSKIILDDDHSFKNKRSELTATVVSWLRENHSEKKKKQGD